MQYFVLVHYLITKKWQVVSIFKLKGNLSGYLCSFITFILEGRISNHIDISVFWRDNFTLKLMTLST